jgi:hypothetical protein
VLTRSLRHDRLVVLAWADRLARRRFGPVLLAVLFALISLPVVMLEVPGYDPATFTGSPGSPRLSLLDPAVLLASIGAVLAAAFVASAVVTALARGYATLGAVCVIPIAWMTAIFALPVLPALLGLPYGTAMVCIDACNLQITRAATGFQAFVQGFWLSPMFAPLTLVSLAVGAVIWGRIVRRAALRKDLVEPRLPPFGRI